MQLLVLQWILNNKLATLGLAMTLILSLLLGAAKLRIDHLSSDRDVLEAKVAKNSEIIDGWQRTTRLANQNREAAQVRIADLQKQNKVLVDRLRRQAIPQDCSGAIEWARKNYNEVTHGW